MRFDERKEDTLRMPKENDDIEKINVLNEMMSQLRIEIESCRDRNIIRNLVKFRFDLRKIICQDNEIFKRTN